MAKAKNDTAQLLRRSFALKYIMVFEGVLVGAAAGTLAVLYRIALDRSEAAMRWVLAAIQGRPLWVAGWFLLLILLGLIVGRLVQYEPLISGSGIPQVSGELRGYLSHRWWRVILCKMAGGTLCILGGLSLGREGPSVQLGAMAGKGISRLFGRERTEEKYLLTCGAGAGLAAAFNAPLAGILFSLEEMHKNFSSTALVSGMAAAITADFISKNIFGLSPVFHFPVAEALPLRHYWLILLLGLLLGALGAFYNWFTLKAQALYQKLPLRPALRPLLPFLAAGVLGFTLPQVLGGGHAMIDLLTSGQLLVGGMLLLLLVKFLFSALSFGSGAPGGIFFPLLVLGAYIGGICGTLAVQALGLEPSLVSNFIILAMAGYFTAIVRAPITGIILIAEMTGSLTHLLSLAVVSIIAYVTAYLLRSAPIYESLLSRILRRQGIRLEEDEGGKVLVEAVVQPGAEIEGKMLRELRWPKECLVVSIRRGGAEIIPDGSTVILAGDTLVALSNQREQLFVDAQLRAKCAEL